MALATSALLAAGAGVAGGLAQAGAARSAAKAQQQSAEQQLALQREMWDTTRQDLSPYRNAGENYLSALNYDALGGTAPMINGQQYQGIDMSPGAQFALQQGVGDIQASAAARGGLRSGNALQSLEGFRFGLAAQDRDNQLNRLAGLAGMGMNAAGMNAANNQALAQGGSNALVQAGNAQSAGAIGVGNAINGTINNLTGVWKYLQ